jgi:hypothetical protein
MRCFRFSLATRIMLLAWGLSVFAQVNRPPTQWVGDLLFTNNTLGFSATHLVDDKNIIVKEIPLVKNIAGSSLLPDSLVRHLFSYWRNDSLYANFAVINEEDEGGTFCNFGVAKWQDDEWQLVGSYKTYGIEMLFHLIPCDNDLFIAVPSYVDITGNKDQDRTPFARMKLYPEKKELRVAGAINHGMDDDLKKYMLPAPAFSSHDERLRTNRTPNDIRAFMAANACFNLASNSNVVMTDGHATLINYETGLYWVFSLEKAALVKAGKIFGEKDLTTEMIAKGGFANAILSAHPEKDGTVLVSAQPAKAFTTVADLAKEMDELSRQQVTGPGATMTTDDFIKLWGNRERQVAYQNPIIEWYRIYPENGKLEKLGLPPIGAAIDRDGGKNNFWRPMPDGEVEMGIMKLKQPEPTKAEQPKKDEGAAK